MSDTNNKSLYLMVTSNIIIISAAYLYFTGWVFCYFLYSNFGIFKCHLEIPFYYFFVYSFSVFIYWLSFLLFGIAIFLGIILYLVVPHNIKKPFIKWAIIIFLIILVPASYYLAKKRAYEEEVRIRSGINIKTIKFFIKKDAAEYYTEIFKEANSKGYLILLAATKERYYVLYQPKDGNNPKEIPFGYVYDIPVSDISHSMIEIMNVSR